MEQGLRKAEGEDARLACGLEDPVFTSVGEGDGSWSVDPVSFGIRCSGCWFSDSCSSSSIDEQSLAKRLKRVDGGETS